MSIRSRYISMVQSKVLKISELSQRIENKELAGGRRMGQNDSQHFMAETKRSKKATTTMQCRATTIHSRRWDS